METFLNYCDVAPLLPILDSNDLSHTMMVGEALLGLGFRFLQVCMRVASPLEQIEALTAAFGDQAMIGASSVTCSAQIDAIARAGGRLVTMPHTSPVLIDTAKSCGLICIPGCFTPTEAFTAIDSGADSLKWYPAVAKPSGVLKALRQVIPREIKLFAAGGIEPEDMAQFHSAGASGFGLGNGFYTQCTSAEQVQLKSQPILDEAAQLGLFRLAV
jgi:2-dehydro-3-deoxyphosphogalactonate aldolase